MTEFRSTALAAVTVVCLAGSTAFADVIDFAGGVATLNDGSTVTTTNAALYQDIVDYYVEDGMRVDFVGDYGTIGDYYSINGNQPPYLNSVIHGHWELGLTSIVFSRVDGSAFDLNYVDVTSNTVNGGGQATGAELSYITTSGGHALLLPSSDWGFDPDYFGNPGDGVARLYLDGNFDNITSFTLTSQNAFCFGMDNFYIDQEAPPLVPLPPAAWMGLVLLTGLGVGKRLRRGT